MKINKAGLDIIKYWEKCKLKAYKDVVGVWTIGWGHTGGDVYEGLVITQQKADELLASDLKWAEDGINNLVKVKLNENQFSALVSLVYNIGIANFSKYDILRNINKGDFSSASSNFDTYVYATDRLTGKKLKLNGLVKRRAQEKELFTRVV